MSARTYHHAAFLTTAQASTNLAVRTNPPNACGELLACWLESMAAGQVLGQRKHLQRSW
jgi:hypothetical protein